MFRLALLGCVLFGVVALPAAVPAQKKASVLLKWKFRAGDAFDLEESLVGKTSLSVSGNKTTEEHVQRRVSRFTVTRASADGYSLEQRINTWQSTITGGLGNDQDDTKLMEQLVKDLVFSIQLSPSGAVTRFDGFDKFIERLEGLDPIEAKRFKAAIGEESLRAPLDQLFHVLPLSPVTAGQPWTYQHVVPLGPLGTYTMATEYSYKGPSDALEEINTKSLLSFEPRKGDAASLGFRVIKLDLTKKNGTGRILFDNIAGRLVRMEMKLNLAGVMKLDLMGTEVDVQLDGTDTRTVRFTDPAGKT